MAKRGIMQHPKLLFLAESLDIMDCFALGILEAFWHLVAKHYPTGDITNLKPSILAKSIGYKADAQVLWDALKESGFVEETNGRVLVHDWSEHADNSVQQLLKAQGALFADGSRPFSRSTIRARKQAQDEDLGSTQDIHESVGGVSQTDHELFTNDSRLPLPKPIVNLSPNGERERVRGTGRDDDPPGEAKPPPSAGKPARFSRPNPDELADYFRELGSCGEESRRFWDYYTANGWKVGKNPMVNWQAAARNWVSRARESPPRSGSNPSTLTTAERLRRGSRLASG